MDSDSLLELLQQLYNLSQTSNPEITSEDLEKLGSAAKKMIYSLIELLQQREEVLTQFASQRIKETKKNFLRNNSIKESSPLEIFSDKLSEEETDLLEMLNAFESEKENSAQEKKKTAKNNLKQEALKESSPLEIFSDKLSEEETDLLEMLNVFESEKKESDQGKTILKDFSQKHSNDSLPLQKRLPTEKRYMPLKTLGEGGMGIVQLAKDNLLGREVALKRIKTKNLNLQRQSGKQDLLLWRLSQEASITAFLEHPNIIPLYEMQQFKNGDFQFTMRKVVGKTLQEILKEKREKKTERDIEYLLSIFYKVGDAISYAHSKEVIHRDLKPENIMVGEFGEVYVMDWGIAKRLNEKTEELQNSSPTQKFSAQCESIHQTIGGLGTEGYMAPEQREDARNVGIQADIYALGKILRQCFTGFSPIEEFKLKIESDAHQREQKNITKRRGFVKEETLEDHIPEEIQAIIKKATEDEWKIRYASVQDLIRDIKRFQKNERISAHRYSFLATLLKWSERNWKWLLFFLVSFALISNAFKFQSEFKEKQEELAQKEQELFFLKESFSLLEVPINSLEKSLFSPNLYLNLQALKKLNAQKKLALPKYLPRLVSFLKSEHYSLRSQTASLLVKMKFSLAEFFPLVAKHFESSSLSIQPQIIRVINHQKPERFIYLFKLLENKSPSLRFLALKALKERPPSKDKILPHLMKRLDDPSSEIRSFSAHFIQKILTNSSLHLKPKYQKKVTEVLKKRESPSEEIYWQGSKLYFFLSFLFGLVLTAFIVISAKWFRIKRTTIDRWIATHLVQKKNQKNKKASISYLDLNKIMKSVAYYTFFLSYLIFLSIVAFNWKIMKISYGGTNHSLLLFFIAMPVVCWVLFLFYFFIFCLYFNLMRYSFSLFGIQISAKIIILLPITVIGILYYGKNLL